MATNNKKSLYDMQYAKEKNRRVNFLFSKQYDADILAQLDSVPNKQGYIKELIRADIARKAQAEPTAQNPAD